jgi:spore photoproduct lyase
MIIYVEKQAKDYPQTQKILQKYKNASVIFIEHYKNIFDKNFENLSVQKSIIIAKLDSPAVTEAPAWYGHTKQAYFFKTSLNCVFDCSYCFLKWAFKNDNMVFFVNYDDIKQQISDKIMELKNSGIQEEIWFYSSDYSDIQGMDIISWFNQEFIPFFDEFEWVKMEVRTKAWNVQSLLDLWFAPKNTEIAFSLNPQSLIEKYESGTATLKNRMKATNLLLEHNFTVWLRFLPLLPVKNYKEIYQEFINEMKQEINFCDIASTFASGLLFTKRDYNTILKKYPDLDILHLLELENDDFYREAREVRDTFYTMFKNLDNKCLLCLEN